MKLGEISYWKRARLRCVAARQARLCGVSRFGGRAVWCTLSANRLDPALSIFIQLERGSIFEREVCAVEVKPPGWRASGYGVGG